MKNYKFLTSLLFLVVLLSGCSRTEENDGVKSNSSPYAKINERTDALPLFGNTHIVPVQVAKSLAKKINLTVPEVMRQGSPATIRPVDSLFVISDSLGTPVLYIANYADDGFVVISADDRYQPVCALVEHGKYEPAEAPSMLLQWFEINYENILKMREGIGSTESFADAEWVKVIKDAGLQEALMIEDCCPGCPNYPDCLSHPSLGCGEPDILCDGNDGNDDPCWPYNTTTKGPLMTTKWDQGCTFNDLCPDKDCDNVCGANENAWTGCVATAMAQVLRYWAHPGPQQYNFGSMPNVNGNSEVQQLMKDIGIAVDMHYSCEGSGALGSKIPEAFKNTFEYNSAERSDYGPADYQKVIQNLNNNQPVILEGCRTQKKYVFGLLTTYTNCHAWVCDGYERHQNSCYAVLNFYMNWGWGGSFNGWFYYNTWSPGTYNYQYAETFIYNIKP